MSVWTFIANLDWSAILTAFGLTIGTISGLFVGFGKLLINRWIDRGKLKLQKKLDEQLETHKAVLVRTTNELQERLRIEYSNLYKERLTAIKEIYEYLFRIECELQDFSFDPDIIGSQEELDYVTGFMSNISDIIMELDKKIGLTLIYFSEDDAKALLNIIEPLNKLVSQWHKWESREDALNDTAALVKSIKSCQTGPIRTLLTTIRSNFRKLVGVK